MGESSAQLWRSMHIGQLIKQELENQGRSVVWFSEKMSYSRTNIYKIFDRPSIDADVLLRISILLDVDFFKYYSSELKNKKDWKFFLTFYNLFTGLSLIGFHAN